MAHSGGLLLPSWTDFLISGWVWVRCIPTGLSHWGQIVHWTQSAWGVHPSWVGAPSRNPRILLWHVVPRPSGDIENLTCHLGRSDAYGRSASESLMTITSKSLNNNSLWVSGLFPRNIHTQPLEAGPMMRLRSHSQNCLQSRQSAHLPTWAASASQPWAQMTGLRDAAFFSDTG